MTGEGRSTFLALWPPPGVRAALSACAVRASAGGFVSSVDHHLTVLYLGCLTEDGRNRVADAFEGFRFPAFRCSLDRVGTFRAARVLWAGPAIVPPSLVLLHTYLAALDLPRGENAKGKRRPFRPHVTLARGVREPHAGVLDPPCVWTVRDLVLAVRAPGGRGVYRRLARWRLGVEAGRGGRA